MDAGKNRRTQIPFVVTAGRHCLSLPERGRLARAAAAIAASARMLVLSLGCLAGLTGCHVTLVPDLGLVSSPAPTANLDIDATGVAGPQGVELANNGTDLTFVATGRTPWCCVTPGAAYDITVVAQPTNPRETCVVANGSGVTGSSGVITVTVTCTVDTGRFLYLTSSASNSLSAFAIDALTGAPTPLPGSPIATGRSPVAIALDPGTRYAYVVNRADGTLSGFTIDSASGLPTAFAAAPARTGALPTAVAVDQGGSAVYVANSGAGRVSEFSLDAMSGALTPVAGSPFAAGVAPSAVYPDGIQSYLYVVDRTSDTLGAYAVDPVTRALAAVPAGPLATGAGPVAIAAFAPALDQPNARFLYVLNATDGTVSGYGLNNTSAALAAVAGSPLAAGTSPSAIAVDSPGGFVYVANRGSGNVSAYRLDPAGGGLVELAGSPFIAAGGPAAIAVETSGRFLYVANELAGSVSAYSIDAATGGLVPVAGSPFAVGTGPIALVVGD